MSLHRYKAMEFTECPRSDSVIHFGSALIQLPSGREGR